MDEETKLKKKKEADIAFGLFNFSQNVADKSLTLIISAFGLVAALAWNDAIKKAINTIFKADNTLISLFVYAIVITILAVVVTARLAKLQDKVDKEENKK